MVWEQHLRQLSVGQRIAVMIALLLLPMAVLSVVSAMVLNDQEMAFRESVQESIHTLLPLTTLEHYLQRALIDELEAQSNESVPNFAALTDNIDQSFASIETSAQGPDLPESMVTSAQQAWREARPSVGRLIEQVRSLHPAGNTDAALMTRQELQLAIQDIDQARQFKFAPLHDIGKVGIPDRILLKPAQLTPEEFEVMKNHTLLGRDAIDQAAPVTADPARRALSAPLSAELEQLLAEAEQRVPMQVSADSSPPSPEEEIEAVLPAELLESLDEPLEEEDDDDVGHESAYQPGARTGAGGSRHTTGAGGGGSTSGAGTHGATGASSHTGGGTGASAGTGPGDTGVGSKARRLTTGVNQDVAIEPPITPPPVKTHGGTHSGTSSTGGTTGHGVEPERARSQAPPPMAVSIRGESQLPPAMSLARPPDIASVAFALPPSVIVAGEAPRILARAIAMRTTGGVAFDSPDGVRRAVFREGDVVTCASGSDDESLLAFLGVRGELPRETVQRLIGKFPAFGRHAGAALVAHGYLRQDQLWPILRAHAEWILGRMLEATAGNAVYEADPPGRLRAEPGVFGGSTGAEVFVEVLRRVEAPGQAIERLGGGASRIGDGENASLLSECALGARELALVSQARGRSVQQVLDAAPDSDIATVLHAMACLGVVEILRAVGRSSSAPAGADGNVQPGIDALDEDAIRARVRARLQLVDEGDYFAVLGVARTATGYEVKRAFLELRRELEPARILTPAVADLEGDVRKIVGVLEEAYEILHDPARRERYRRAIDAVPKA